jgi:hypothetical protein
MFRSNTVAVCEDSPIHLLTDSIRLALQQIGHGQDFVREHLAAQWALQAMPLATSDYARANANLANAAAYLEQGERGAACYELQSLLRRLSATTCRLPQEPRRRLRRRVSQTAHYRRTAPILVKLARKPPLY